VKAQIASIYSVHRQPKLGLATIAAPIMGPSVGPPVTAIEYKITAGPRSDGTHISPRAADTLLTGADPNTPPKNRVMKIAAAFLLVAVPIDAIPRKNMAGSIPHLLPQISDTGAQHSGPRANPALHESLARNLY